MTITTWCSSGHYSHGQHQQYGINRVGAFYPSNPIQIPTHLFQESAGCAATLWFACVWNLAALLRRYEQFGGIIWYIQRWFCLSLNQLIGYIYILAGNYICMQTKGKFAILPTWTSSCSTDVSLISELWFHQWVSKVSNKFRTDCTKVSFKSAELPLIGKGIRTFRDFLRLTTVGFICGFPIIDIISKPLRWRSRISCNACQGH